MTKVALITGAAKRIGAEIAKTLHQAGLQVIIHYHHSAQEAQELCQQLNAIRSNSAATLCADINQIEECYYLIKQASHFWGNLDILINNASRFYPTPVEKATDPQWEDLMNSNLKGPFFLCQASIPYLRTRQGTIINLVDIHADKPLKNYPIYSIAKAGLVMLTKALARELAPSIRVNAIAPGVILFPTGENALSPEAQDHLIAKTCLKRRGSPQDIANTVLFLIQQTYITGQVIAVDGGRSIKD